MLPDLQIAARVKTSRHREQEPFRAHCSAIRAGDVGFSPGGRNHDCEG